MANAWMPTLVLILALEVSGALAQPAAIPAESLPLAGPWEEDALYSPSWYAHGEALFYTRDQADRRSISGDNNNMGTITILMSTDALEFDYQPGARFTVGRRVGDTALEISYFGIEQYSATAQVTSADAPNGILYSPMSRFDGMGSTPPFDYADLHRISYSSNLHNAELNLRRHLARGGSVEGSLLVGLRYMKVHERFDFFSAANDYPSLGPASGTLGAITDNDLFGAQLGADLLWHATQRFSLQAGAKGAMLGNSAVRHGYIEYEWSGFSFRDDTGARGQNLSSIVEAGLFGIFQATPSVRLRAGYQVLMVGGLALAPTQLNFGDDLEAGSDVKQQGSTVFHGPSCGLEATW